YSFPLTDVDRDDLTAFAPGWPDGYIVAAGTRIFHPAEADDYRHSDLSASPFSFFREIPRNQFMYTTLAVTCGGCRCGVANRIIKARYCKVELHNNLPQIANRRLSVSASQLAGGAEQTIEKGNI
ncbi:MAG TPA: hypothetical protein VNI02_22855, partial [Blastocatellia bacterium]|nr:hypothetical protein [Blastocatellia bacterium]